MILQPAHSHAHTSAEAGARQGDWRSNWTHPHQPTLLPVLVWCCGPPMYYRYVTWAREDLPELRCMFAVCMKLTSPWRLGIAPEHPFFPQLEQCFNTNPLDSTAFVSMKGASGHPCTCSQARHDYDYDCSCLLLLLASRVDPAFLSSIRCCGCTLVDHNRTCSPVSIKDGTPAFPFISAIVLSSTPTQTVDRLTCRGQCLVSIHTVATLFHCNSTARRRLSIKLNPLGADTLSREIPRARP